MIKLRLGGISTPSVPPQASVAHENAGSYPCLRISGRATDAMVTPQASESPQIAAKPAQPIIAAMPREAGVLPIQIRAALNMSELMPEASDSSPIRQKSGTTASVAEKAEL